MNLQENISRIKKVIGLLTEEIDFDNITFFKTSQGSKYIRLSDGRLKRWKSYHQNTAGEDIGLHSWSDFSFFVDPKFYDSVSAFEQLSTNKGYKVALTKDKAGKLAYLIFDSGNWRPAKWEDAFPKYVENNPGLKGNVLTWEYSKEPQIGFHTVDGNFKNKSSQLSSFHIGNPVSEISNLTDEDKKLFFPSYFMNPQKDIIVYDYVEGRNTVPMSDRYNFDADKLVNAGVIFITPAMDGDPDSPTYKEWLDEDSSHLITLYNVEHSSPDSWIREAITKKSNTSEWKDNFIGKLYDGKYNQILWSLDKLGIDPNDMVIEDNSLQENISRIREVMGLLTEVTNPYKVEWLKPTQEYFKQELSELLGNLGRFTDKEFFSPKNYDTVYRIMPHTFKTVAEFVKGEKIENPGEIKDILLNNNVGRTIVSGEGEWDKLKDILMNNPKSIKEAYDFFSRGQMTIWKGVDPNTGEYVNKVNNTNYMGGLTDFMEPLKPTVSSKMSRHLKKVGDEEGSKDLPVFAGNIDKYREFAKKGETRKLPAPFVVKYFTKKGGDDYVLIGGFKRSSIALQMGIEPIKVWLIDLTK